MKEPHVYILASGKNKTLYIGVTSNLTKRISEHKAKEADSFTKKYSIDKLMWFEAHDTMESAILREKQMKKWKREYKIRLIEGDNPGWKDLSDDWE